MNEATSAAAATHGDETEDEEEDDCRGYYSPREITHHYDDGDSKLREDLKTNVSDITNLTVHCLHTMDNVQRLGECINSNTNLRSLSLSFLNVHQVRVEQEGEQDGDQHRLWDAAYSGVYEFLEKSPALMNFTVHDYFGLTGIVDNFLYRLALRKQKNPSLSNLQRVELRNCVFCAAVLTCLLRNEQVKVLKLYCDSPLVPANGDLPALHQALSENSSLESLILCSYSTFLLGLSTENQCKVRSLTFCGSDSHDHPARMIPDDWKDNILQFLARSRHLREVRLEGNLTPSDFEMFVIGTSQTSCKQLRLKLNCFVDKQDHALFVDMVRRTANMQKLQVLGDSSMLESALHGLCENRSVQKAVLSSTEYNGGPQARHKPVSLKLSQLLNAHHPTLRSLHLFNISNPSCISALFQALSSNTSLTSLHFSMLPVELDDQAASQIARCFELNTSLARFTLCAEFQRISAVSVLYDGLKSTQARTTLQLTKCDDLTNLQDVGCENLCCLTARFIEQSRSLVSISVKDETFRRPCTVKCTEELLRAVEKSRTLRSFCAPLRCGRRDCRVACRIANQLVSSLPRIQSLRHLNIDLSFGMGHMEDDVVKALARNYSLESLDLKWNFSQDPKAQYYLKRNRSLRKFLCKTETDPPGLLALALATVTPHPSGAFVVYDLLRRNVHALTTSRASCNMNNKRKQVCENENE